MTVRISNLTHEKSSVWESAHEVRDDMYMYGAQTNLLITSTVAQQMVLKTRRRRMLHHVTTRQTFREILTNPNQGDMTGWILIPSAVEFSQQRPQAPNNSTAFCLLLDLFSMWQKDLINVGVEYSLFGTLIFLTVNINTDNNMCIVPLDLLVV
jgi:hypothetical protein